MDFATCDHIVVDSLWHIGELALIKEKEPRAMGIEGGRKQSCQNIIECGSRYLDLA